MNRNAENHRRGMIIAAATVALSVALAALPGPAAAQQATPLVAEATATAAAPLTVEEAVTLALDSNLSLRAARQQWEVQNGVVAERRAARNPILSAGGNFNVYDRGQNAAFGGQNVSLFNRRQREGSLAAQVPLDFSGQLRTATGRAQLTALAARFGYETAVNDLVARVRTDYNAVLRRQALVDVAEDNLANSRERLRVVEAEVKAGKSPLFDALRARTDARSAEEALLRAKNDVTLATAQLRRTLGVSQQSPIAVAGDTATTTARAGWGETSSTLIAATDANPEAPEENLFEEARQARPEVRRAEAGLRAAERDITLARRESDPQVSVAAGYTNTPDAAGLGPLTRLGNVGLSVRLPLFDGGVRKAREQQARAGVDAARADLADVREQAAFETRQALLNRDTARERIPVAEAALEQARESYRLSRVRFEAGVAPLVEVTDAQAALTHAQTDLVHARYDLKDAEAALNRSLGRYATLAR